MGLTVFDYFDHLREYVHGRQDLVRTLHDLDAELARTGGTQRMLSNNSDIKGFLSVLADALQHELSFLRVDYMTLDAACRAMFRRIDESIGNEAVGEEDPSILGSYDRSLIRDCLSSPDGYEECEVWKR